MCHARASRARFIHARCRDIEGADAALAAPVYLRDKIAWTAEEREAIAAAKRELSA